MISFFAFQFHIGAIRRLVSGTNIKGIKVFQFHIGAIRSSKSGISQKAKY